MRDLVAPPQSTMLFSDFMALTCTSPEPWRVRVDDHHLVRPTLEWEEARWRLGPGCELYGSGTLELDPDIPDARLKIEAPFQIVPSAIKWAAGLFGWDAWRRVPNDMYVHGLRFVLNHSKVAPRARAIGVSYRSTAAALQGHHAVIENVSAFDCGATLAEAFPFTIVGAQDGEDRHALASVADGAHFFDNDVNQQSRIENVQIEGYVPGESNAQVSHAVITGALCNDRLRADGVWGEIGNWSQILRRNPRIANVHGVASGSNLCQLATIYQCLGGEITTCSTKGYSAGAYGDFFASYDLEVHHNDFEAERPVAFLLSPPDPNASPAEQIMPLHFLHARPLIRSNKLRCLPVDTGSHGGVLLNRLGGGGARRISGVVLDDNEISMQGKEGRANFAVNAHGVDRLDFLPTNRVIGFTHPFNIMEDCTGVTPPEIQRGFKSSKRGCNPFSR